jgi:hypothetical protein
MAEMTEEEPAAFASFPLLTSHTISPAIMVPWAFAR